VELTIGHGSNMTVNGLLLIAIAGLVTAIGIIRLSRLDVPFNFVSDIMVSIPGPGDTVMDRDHIARTPN
jgi:hypothetical protein